MKQSFKSLTAAFGGALLAGQVSFAIPPSLNVSDMIARDDAPVPRKLFGDSGRPVIDDLAKDSFFGLSTRDVGLDALSNVMLGFAKCNQGWVETWFPSSDELAKLKGTKSLADGEGYFLKYDAADGKRLAVSVSSDWQPPGDHIHDNLSYNEGAPWWPKAALQGALDGKKLQDLTIAELTLAITGEKLVNLKKSESEDADALFKIMAQGYRTPVWVLYAEKWYVIKSARSIFDYTTLQMVGGEISESSTADYTADKVPGIKEIYYLEGLPSFLGRRKGELQL